MNVIGVINEAIVGLVGVAAAATGGQTEEETDKEKKRAMDWDEEFDKRASKRGKWGPEQVEETNEMGAEWNEKYEEEGKGEESDGVDEPEGDVQTDSEEEDLFELAEYWSARVGMRSRMTGNEWLAYNYHNKMNEWDNKDRTGGN